MSSPPSNNPSIFKIEYAEENVGRIQKSSKKWVTWRFQIVTTTTEEPSSTSLAIVPVPVDLLMDPLVTPPTPAAVEYDSPEPLLVSMSKTYSISVSWSLASGKQEIEMNGQTIWFGRRPGGAVLSHAWLEDDLELEVLGTSQAPKRHVSPGFRCFDLMINGRTFEELPILGKHDATSLATIAAADLPTSVVEILYPDGYQWKPTNVDSDLPNSYTGHTVY